METPSTLETAQSYVPDFVKRRVIANPQPLTEPVAERFYTAVFFADISGFTALTERLTRKGPLGAENLSHALNEYFGKLVDVVRAGGGDVVKFAGDGMTALWPTSHNNNSPLALQEVILQATQCAVFAQHILQDFPEIEGTRLSLKIGLGVGEVYIPHLGGLYGRWEYLLTGDPLVQVSMAENQAVPGQIIASPEVWELVKEHCVGELLPTGFTRIIEMSQPVTLTPAAELIPSEEMLPAFYRYIPGAIQSRLNAGQVGWLAELRRISIIFAFLPDINHKTPLADAQAVMHGLQTALYKYEGSVNKISVDDKGAMLVAALGLPPFAHEDDPARAVLAALQMNEALTRLNRGCAIGVTTGQAFCGTVGNSTRREYTMLGDVVNLSARLMQAALRYGDALPVLCDQATYEAAKNRVEFSALPAIAVKGKTEPVPIYAPKKIKRIVTGASAIQGMVGRQKERHQLIERLKALIDGEGRTVIVEGDPGIGKSQLLADILKESREIGIRPFMGAGDSIEQATAYHAWRPIFRDLFNLGDNFNTSIIQSSLATHILRDPYLRERAPLLNAIFPLGLNDTAVTAQMSGDVRATNTRELLLKLFTQRTQNKDLLLVMEDAQWLDSSSWALLTQARRQNPAMLLIIVTRPWQSEKRQPPAEFLQLQADPLTERIVIGELSDEEVLTLACQKLGVDELPEPAAKIIRDQSEGHPFFCQEIAFALRDTGLLHIHDRVAEMGISTQNGHTVNFPTTIQGIITSRIDRLDPPQQLSLKVAAVIGRVFSLKMLQAIHPVPADRDSIPSFLLELTAQGLIAVDNPESDPSFRFRHTITQEVAYNLLPYAQRQRLHRAAAEWLEVAYSSDLSHYSALLASHWSQTIGPDTETHVVETTINYLEKAGEYALHDGAYHEAINYLNQARQLMEQIRPDGQPNQSSSSYLNTRHTAHRALLLGDAYIGLGQLPEAQECLLQLLKTVRHPFPTSEAELKNELEQLQRGALNIPRPVSVTAEAQQEILDLAQAYDRLGHIFFVTNRPFETSYATMRGLKIAQQVAETPLLASLHARMYGVMTTLQPDQQAETHAQKAIDIAHQLQDANCLADVLFHLSIFKIGKVSWAEVQELLNRCITLCEQLGDKHRLGDSLEILMYVWFWQGEYEKSIAISDALQEVAVQSGNSEHRAWGLYGRALNLLRLGQTQHALPLVEQATQLFRTAKQGSTAEGAALATLAYAHFLQNDPRQARQAADRAWRLLNVPLPTFFVLVLGYEGLLRTYLGLWFYYHTNNQTMTAVHQILTDVGQALKQFGKHNPIGRPGSALAQGQLEWVIGRVVPAFSAWEQAVQLAQEQQMPYEEGLAHLYLGQHLPVQNPGRVAHLQQALTIFKRLQCPAEIEEIQKLL